MLVFECLNFLLIIKDRSNIVDNIEEELKDRNIKKEVKQSDVNSKEEASIILMNSEEKIVQNKRTMNHKLEKKCRHCLKRGYIKINCPDNPCRVEVAGITYSEQPNESTIFVNNLVSRSTFKNVERKIDERCVVKPLKVVSNKAKESPQRENGDSHSVNHPVTTQILDSLRGDESSRCHPQHSSNNINSLSNIAQPPSNVTLENIRDVVSVGACDHVM